MKRLLALVLVMLSPLGLAACGEEDEPAATMESTAAASPTASGTATDAAVTGATDSTVAAALDEWSIAPEPASVQAGTIEFEAENVGKQVHELEVVKTDKAPDAFPVKDGTADVEAVGEEIGEVEDVGAGQTKEFAVNLDAGEYVLICNLPAHYEQGMTVAFTVDE